MKNLASLLCLSVSITANASNLYEDSGPFAYYCNASYPQYSSNIAGRYYVVTQSKGTTLAGNQLALYINQNVTSSPVTILGCEPAPDPTYYTNSTVYFMSSIADPE